MINRAATNEGIAPNELTTLLPDSGIVELPKLAHVNGGLGYRFVKRVIDVICCSCALLVLAIPMGVIACKINSESPGPAIYVRERVGKGGRFFKMYKFRSMYDDAEEECARWEQAGDPRVTLFGRFLRKRHFDEIPQFWNVVKGDMSLVGPRPERPAFHYAFMQRIRGWDQRVAVRPGITGLSQDRGGYELLPKKKALLDIEYIENLNMAMDLSIALRTIRTLLIGEGRR